MLRAVVLDQAKTRKSRGSKNEAECDGRSSSIFVRKVAFGSMSVKVSLSGLGLQQREMLPVGYSPVNGANKLGIAMVKNIRPCLAGFQLNVSRTKIGSVYQRVWSVEILLHQRVWRQIVRCQNM